MAVPNRPSITVAERVAAPALLALFTVGLGYTVIQGDARATSDAYQRLAPLLSAAVVSLALLACGIAYLRSRNAADVLAGRLALAIPCLVWASQAIAGTHAVPDSTAVHSDVPSMLRIVIGVVGTALIASDLVSRERALIRSLVLRTLVSSAGVAAGLGLATVALRDRSALQLDIRANVASTVLPVIWALLAVVLVLSGQSSRRLLRRCLGAFLLLLAVGQFVHPPRHIGVHGARVTFTAVAGVLALLVVVIGLGCELRAAYESQQRRLVALELDRTLAAAQQDADRLASSRRAHDQRAALLSVEAVIKLLEGGAPPIDLAARRRLSGAAVEELQRLRTVYEETDSPTKRVDADLRELVEPVVAVARAEGAKVELVMRPGLTVHVVPSAVVDILRNLVSNAVHHGGNEAVTVTARRADYEFVELVVSDGGPGVSAARRFDLFQPGRSSGGPERSGLGLDSARSQLRDMGGELILDRTHKRGSRFVARIPVGTGAGPGPSA